jgi:hypothetical protein
VKQIASILFAFLLLWHPSTPAAANGSCCGGELAMAAARCCACCASTPQSFPVSPLTPVQSRPSAPEQITLLLPTFTTQLMLEQSAQSSTLPKAEFSYSAGALPLFQRDCALLL